MAFNPQGHKLPLSQPMVEIITTPLDDVMLVLLVIFMITAPLMSSALRLDLPRAEGAQPSDAPQSIELAIDAQGRLFAAGAAVDEDALRARVAEAARLNPATEVQLRADRSVPYGRVVEVMDAAQAAGLTRMGFVAQPSTQK